MSRRGRRGKGGTGEAAPHAPAGARDRTHLEHSAGGVVFRRVDGIARFLLIRDPYQNWGLPKGHIEPGETPLQAALREVTEETGLSELVFAAELPCIDWYFRDHGKLVHKFCHFFLIESSSGATTPQLEEGISECSWLPLAEAVHRVTYDNAREVLRAAGRQLGDHD